MPETDAKVMVAFIRGIALCAALSIVCATTWGIAGKFAPVPEIIEVPAQVEE